MIKKKEKIEGKDLKSMKEKIKQQMKEEGWEESDDFEFENQALIWASAYGHTETVKLLLDAGADLHIFDGCALLYASVNGHHETVKLLLDAGADVHKGPELHCIGTFDQSFAWDFKKWAHDNIAINEYPLNDEGDPIFDIQSHHSDENFSRLITYKRIPLDFLLTSISIESQGYIKVIKLLLNAGAIMEQ